MENDINESENAFLQWFNLLNIKSEKIKNIQELRDGVFFMLLLKNMYFYINFR